MDDSDLRRGRESCRIRSNDRTAGPLVYRQFAWTRITHWIWAISLFFLLLTGLQIFNAHPTLYIGDQSGFEFDNEVLAMRRARTRRRRPVGYHRLPRHAVRHDRRARHVGPAERPVGRGFPAWATIPSDQDLATGRVMHFFFAWILVGTLLVWLVASLVNGHLRRDLVPTPRRSQAAAERHRRARAG